MSDSTFRAQIMRSTGSWYDIRHTETGEAYKARLRGKLRLKGLKVTNPVAVGDFVVCEIESQADKIANIKEIEKRKNYIIRQAPHKRAFGHIIAANIDQAILIATLSRPRTSLGFIDRFLVAAESFRIPAVIVFNKRDVLSPEEIELQKAYQKCYESIGYPTLSLSATEDESLDALDELLKGKLSLFSGHSGVGKSTLLNRLAPEIGQATKEISNFSQKGVHTTTFAEIFEIQPETFLIDTPGIKEMALAYTEKAEIAHYFPEMRALLNACKYHNCLHLNEPQCAVIDAVEAGNIAYERYESYISMLENADNRH
ncbi:MAG: ribosome small subunit-dependent GTPase A [Bernardetiaceae bacterium]|nr:ribosome small subunit-dependent GTPase A [Bernardetiaceae bacterium]